MQIGNQEANAWTHRISNEYISPKMFPSFPSQITYPERDTGSNAPYNHFVIGVISIV